MKIRVLIADDHAILRAGLRLLLDLEPDMTVVGEAGDGAEAVTQARKTNPDVVLMDLAMGGHAGIQAIPKVRQACPQARVLVLTMLADPAFLRAALDAGSAGYLLKNAADTELLTAIRTVAQGRSYVHLSRQLDLEKTIAEQTVRDIQHDAGRSLSRLSMRERQVLSLVAQGFTNQEVADQLGLSVKSVETYRSRLTQKLELRSRAALVRFALSCGVLEADKPSA